MFDYDGIQTAAEAFVAYVEDNTASVVNRLEQARTLVLQTALQFATDSVSDDHDESAIRLSYDAAAFLLSNGVVNVDQDTPELVEPGPDEETDGIILGEFDTERDAALAYGRAAIWLQGEAETNFCPEESEHVILSDQVIRQINALKAGRGRLH